MTYRVLGTWAQVKPIRKENSHWAPRAHKLKAFKNLLPWPQGTSQFFPLRSLITHHYAGPLIHHSHSFYSLPREPKIQLLRALLPLSCPAICEQRSAAKRKRERTLSIQMTVPQRLWVTSFLLLNSYLKCSQEAHCLTQQWLLLSSE